MACCRFCNDFCRCIFIALWTLIQSGVHVWWVLAGRHIFACDYEIKKQRDLMVYLTFYYSDECNNSPLQKYVDLNKNVFNATNVVEIEPAFVFPSYADAVTLTDKLMIAYLILDILWIITSVSLLTGTICKIKECSALIFFAPWMLVNVCSVTLDLFAAIYFGLQIPKSKDITDYLTLARIAKDVSLTHRFNTKDLKLPPAAILVIVAGRLGIIWVINVIFLIIIARSTWQAWRQRYSDETKGSHKSNNNNNSRNNAEARIRSWQLFYGKIDEEACGKDDTKHTDLSYNQTFKELEEYNRYKRKSQQFEDDLCSTFKSNSLDQSTPEFGKINNELRGHVPWTYIQNKQGFSNCNETFIKAGKEKRVVVVVPNVRRIDDSVSGYNIKQDDPFVLDAISQF